MTSRHPPVSHVAGVLAAQESRVPSHELAELIMARLDREGFVVVPRDSDGSAYQALADLDAILALRDAADDDETVQEWAGQMGMDDPSCLRATLITVRDVLNERVPA